ncbi:nitronate monooxygenase [Metallumcola ferriviriculae]|uniref:Probable nitronate monooxygenase n=1 Tax=Metallumcola ferriviriculae TaxID=3039180 RepID=A0AAU0UR34_9FIRM|nr:nitronate monooxygenase [Desulfitibacteraceae bacterium MK1]
MIRTRVTDLLDIQYPIIQGGMQWLACAEFAAAVSNAGGLGVISAAMHPSKEDLLEEIRKTRELTSMPFGVNISMLPTVGPGDMTPKYVEAVIEAKVPVVETAGRSPKDFIGDLKQAGVKIIHKVPSVRFAKKAAEIGVDMVTVVGFECGGHPGLDDVPTALIVNKASRAVDIPVLAGGGIVDGRGLLSALSLGAEGVVLGTRFVATQECTAHPAFKEWVVNAQETDTIIIERSIRNPMRAMKNRAAYQVLGMETHGATLKQLLAIISGKVGKKALFEGDIENSTFAIGQAVGLINEIETVEDVVKGIISEAEDLYRYRLAAVFG